MKIKADKRLETNITFYQTVEEVYVLIHVMPHRLTATPGLITNLNVFVCLFARQRGFSLKICTSSCVVWLKDKTSISNRLCFVVLIFKPKAMLVLFTRLLS